MAKGPNQADPQGLAQRVRGEVVDQSPMDSMAANLTRAEIDQQIATAKRYPRSVAAVQRSIETLATLDEQTAAECIYKLPRGNKEIIGPSIRFAEIVMQAWGNCRVAARVTNEGRTHLEATGIYHDLETNTAVAKSITQRITKANGQRYDDDMIGIASAAGTSKALRNAILAGVPKGVWRKGYESAQKVAMGTAATLTERRRTVLAELKAAGAGHVEVYEILGVQGEADITLTTMLTLRAMLTSITTGEQTLDQMLKEVREARKPADKVTDKLAGKAAQAEGFDRGHIDRETGTTGKATRAKAAATDPKPDPKTETVVEVEEEVPAHDQQTGEVAGEGEARTDALEDKGLDAFVPDEEDPGYEISEGHADPGEAYHFDADGVDAQDNTPSYIDGEFHELVSWPESSLRVFTEHAPKVSPDGQDRRELAPGPEETNEIQEVEGGEPASFAQDVTAAAAKGLDAFKVLWGEFNRSDDFKGLTPDEQDQVRRTVWPLVKHLVDHATDPTMFGIWMTTQEGSDGADAIEGTFRTLKREPLFEGMKPAAQATITARVEALVGKLRNAK
jgi:hypothetical protein